MSPVLDLKEAAGVLGVHYQTAYKWVRSGRLDAVVVRGRYQVEPAEVERVARERAQPTTVPARRPVHDAPRAAARAEELLVEGREADFRLLASGLLDRGAALHSVISEVVSPALRHIGAQWHAGALDIATEHRATAIVERFLGEHMPRPRGRRRGTAVVAGPEGDLHSLPTTMAAAAMREDNWHVHHLGADMPAQEIAAFARREEPDLLVLTVTADGARQSALDLAATLEADGLPTLVGGAGQSLTGLLQAARAARRP